MLVRELIQDILDEIGQLPGGSPVSDGDAARCRRLINKAVSDYNVQGFLHFTRSRLTLGTGKEFLFGPGQTNVEVPLTVNAVYYRNGQYNYRLKPVQLQNIPSYEGVGSIPYKFSYDKYFVGDNLMGRITLDRNSTYEVSAVVTYDMQPFNDNDVLTLPPEFINLLTADVQYRLVSNLAINDSLKADKKAEWERLLDFVKETNTLAIDVPNEYCLSIDDKFYGGVGRL